MGPKRVEQLASASSKADKRRRASRKTDLSFFDEGAELDEIPSNQGANSAIVKGEPKRTKNDDEEISCLEDDAESHDDASGMSSVAVEKHPKPLSPLNSDEESICRHHGIGKMQPMRTVLKEFSPMSDLDSDTERKIAAIIANSKGKKNG